MEQATRMRDSAPSGGGPSSSPGAGRGMGILLAVVVLGGIGIGGVFLAMTWKKNRGDKAIIDRRYEEIDLGPISRDLSTGDSAVSVGKTFSCQPVLFLNSKIEELDRWKAEVERRKKLLRGRVLEILFAKEPGWFQRGTLYEDLAALLRDELNRLLGPAQGGQAVIDFVKFTRLGTR